MNEDSILVLRDALVVVAMAGATGVCAVLLALGPRAYLDWRREDRRMASRGLHR